MRRLRSSTPSFNGAPLQEVYPWGTIRSATTEANRATADELERNETEEIRVRARALPRSLRLRELSLTRVLVTGASGFVGAGLARRLVDDGHEVHGLTRPGSDPWRLRGLAPLSEVDLRDGERVRALLARLRPRWVFHLAAHGAYPAQKDWRRMLATNVVGLRTLLESARAAGVETFVQAGSSSEYGFTDCAPAEDDPARPASDYALSKLSATRLCRAFARRHGLRAATLRLYSVYGPWEAPERFVPTLAVLGVDGRLPPLVAPSVARDFVYLDDVVEAFIAVATARKLEPGTVFNVGTGRQVTIAAAVAIARRQLAIAEEPAWSTMPNRAWDTTTWVADPSRIARELGFRARTDFETGFQRLVEWLREDAARLAFYRARV